MAGPDSALLEKKKVIAETILNSAEILVAQAKRLPNTSKHRRNIFTKSYNRRPQNKQKRLVIMAQMCIDASITSVEILRMTQTPATKFLNGNS